MNLEWIFLQLWKVLSTIFLLIPHWTRFSNFHIFWRKSSKVIIHEICRNEKNLFFALLSFRTGLWYFGDLRIKKTEFSSRWIFSEIHAKMYVTQFLLQLRQKCTWNDFFFNCGQLSRLSICKYPMWHDFPTFTLSKKKKSYYSSWNLSAWKICFQCDEVQRFKIDSHTFGGPFNEKCTAITNSFFRKEGSQLADILHL